MSFTYLAFLVQPIQGESWNHQWNEMPIHLEGLAQRVGSPLFIWSKELRVLTTKKKKHKFYTLVNFYTIGSKVHTYRDFTTSLFVPNTLKNLLLDVRWERKLICIWRKWNEWIKRLEKVCWVLNHFQLSFYNTIWNSLVRWFVSFLTQHSTAIPSPYSFKGILCQNNWIMWLKHKQPGIQKTTFVTIL